MTTVGILHPGQMGASLAAAAKANGARVLWAGQGRSDATRKRAEAEGLEDAGTLQALTAASDVVISICPPDAARALARSVAETGFAGVFVDANAVAPETARRVGEIVTEAGADFVDGGVVGPPARAAGLTRLYLSGGRANAVAALFDGTLAEPVVLEGRPGAASALKMCYAAWTKGRTALLLGVRALAEAQGVAAPLAAEWARSQPGLGEDSEQAAVRVSPKAWRWEGEMLEIAAAFEEAGLPDGFHRAASELYAAMAGFKDCGAADFGAVMRAVLENAKPDPT